MITRGLPTRLRVSRDRMAFVFRLSTDNVGDRRCPRSDLRSACINGSQCDLVQPFITKTRPHSLCCPRSTRKKVTCWCVMNTAVPFSLARTDLQSSDSAARTVSLLALLCESVVVVALGASREIRIGHLEHTVALRHLPMSRKLPPASNFAQQIQGMCLKGSRLTMAC